MSIPSEYWQIVCSRMRWCMVGIVLLLVPFIHLEVRAATEVLPPPHYCPEPPPVNAYGGVDSVRALICAGVALVNAGLTDVALATFIAADEDGYHRRPNHDALAFIAIAHHLLGDVTNAEAAMDAAYLALMIRIGYVACDPGAESRVLSDSHTVGISRATIAEIIPYMCSDVFLAIYTGSTAHRRGQAESQIRWYSYARRITGLGRSMPK